MRPILLGMNNPVSPLPEFALYPEPVGCAGWNLWRLSGLERDVWMETFERRNLLDGRTWSVEDARVGADEYRAGRDGERSMILLGDDVSRLMLHDAPHFAWVQRPQGGWWARMPHPSGRCRHWNDPVIRRAAELFLRELAGEA